MYYIQPGQAVQSMICASKVQVSHIMAKSCWWCRNYCSTYLNGKNGWWSTTWYEFVLLLIEPDLKKFRVVDNIAFRAMDERLEFYLNDTRMHANATLKFSHKILLLNLIHQRSDFSFTKKKWNNGTSATTSQPHRTFKINNTYVTIVTVSFKWVTFVKKNINMEYLGYLASIIIGYP
jgi:hypothetical protein